MLIVKWRVTITKCNTKSMTVSIETSAPTIQEASNKMNEILQGFLNDEWELQFSEMTDIVRREK